MHHHPKQTSKNSLAKQIHPFPIKTLGANKENQMMLANFKSSLLSIHDKKQSSETGY